MLRSTDSPAARLLALSLVLGCQTESTTSTSDIMAPVSATGMAVDNVVASVAVIPDSQMVFAKDLFKVTGLPRNKAGQVLTKVPRWTVNNSAVASPQGTGAAGDDLQGPQGRHHFGEGDGGRQVAAVEGGRAGDRGGQGDRDAGRSDGGSGRDGPVRRRRSHQQGRDRRGQRHLDHGDRRDHRRRHPHRRDDAGDIPGDRPRGVRCRGYVAGDGGSSTRSGDRGVSGSRDCLAGGGRNGDVRGVRAQQRGRQRRRRRGLHRRRR